MHACCLGTVVDLCRCARRQVLEQQCQLRDTTVSPQLGQDWPLPIHCHLLPQPLIYMPHSLASVRCLQPWACMCVQEGQFEVVRHKALENRRRMYTQQMVSQPRHNHNTYLST
jgi:hypothetical protein